MVPLTDHLHSDTDYSLSGRELKLKMPFKRIMNVRKYPHRVCIRLLDCFERTQERWLKDSGAEAPMKRFTATSAVILTLYYQPTSTHANTRTSQMGLLSFTQAFGVDSQNVRVRLVVRRDPHLCPGGPPL